MNHLGRVVPPLGFIAIEQCIAELTRDNGCEFPRQIMSIAHAAVHTLACEWRREMRGVAGKKDPAGSPAIGHASMKRVNDFAAKHGPVVRPV